MNINEIAEHAYKRALERGKITEVSAPMKRYAECTNSLKDEFCELLEKIKKITGLDLREFDHAIIFKVALMVKKYLDSREIYTR